MINNQRMRQASRDKLRKFLGESFIDELDGGSPQADAPAAAAIAGADNETNRNNATNSDASANRVAESITVPVPPVSAPVPTNETLHDPTTTVCATRSFNRQKHVKFFERSLQCLPREYAAQDSISMTLLYFAVSGLDILRADDVLKNERKNIIEFVFNHHSSSSPALDAQYNGFIGDYVSPKSAVVRIAPSHAVSATPDTAPNLVTTTTLPLTDAQRENLEAFYEPHIVHTWAALSVLTICGDNFQRINRAKIGALVRACQLPNGSFTASPYTQLSSASPAVSRHVDADDLDTPFAFSLSRAACETDLRFLYVAAAICAIIDDFSYINVDAARRYVEQCRSYEGGYGQVPGAEAHGGSTYCALAALRLLSRSASVAAAAANQQYSTAQRLQTCAWLAQRYDATGAGGFSGRPAKPPDTCYTFWIGASLKLLMLNGNNIDNNKNNEQSDRSPASTASHNALDLLVGVEQVEHVAAFALETQHEFAGGFAKWPDQDPDLLHAYLCLAGMSILYQHLKTSSATSRGGEQRRSSTSSVLFGFDELQPVNAELNVSERAMRWLAELHETWRKEGAESKK